MTEFEPTIGLEVHCQLKTKTKIFCACPTEFGRPPNENTCPVCLGMPGVLPVLNKEVVHQALKAALALNCEIQQKSIWARKNYFYPDLPKGYQISQYERPYALGGFLKVLHEGQELTIPLERIHMEEDAGKLVHDYGDPNSSHIDLNRAGTPLIEIVTKPALKSSTEAGAYLRALRAIVRYCGVSDGNMEEGSLRCDANVSIKPIGTAKLGTKVEIKNLNSFKHIEKAIDYEIERQHSMLLSGQKIIQETRLWDTAQHKTFSMRSKEEAHDYRYFPDPDLVPLIIDDVHQHQVLAELPELPDQKRRRYVETLALPMADAQVLTAEQELADYFEATIAQFNQPKKVANWIMTELLGELNQRSLSIADCPISPARLAGLLALIDQGQISGKIAKDVLGEMFSGNKDATTIVAEKGLSQVSDTAELEAIAEQIIQANPKQVEQFRAGKDKVLGFFVGQIMKAMQGRANPQLLNEIVRKKLK